MTPFPAISEENFQTMFRDAEVGMSMSTPDGTQIQVNAALCRMLGYTADELLRINVLDLTCSEDRDRTSVYFREAKAGQRTFFSYQKCYLHKNGSRVWALTSVFWINDPEGDIPQYCVALIQDLTQQKLAEKNLAARENLYRTLVENIDLGISLIDADHRIVMVNSTFSKWFEKPAGEFAGKHCFGEFEKRSGVCDHCPGVPALESGQPREVITEGVRDDGSRFTVRVQAFPLLGSDGQAKQFIEVVQDITEQRQAEEALRRSEAWLRSIFQHAAAPMAIAAADGGLLDVNNAFCKFLNTRREDLLKKGVSDITHPDDLDLTLTHFDEGRKGEVDSYTYEKRYLRSDGSTVWGMTTVTWLSSALADERQCVALIQDITAKKEAESRVEKFAFFDTLTGLPNRTSLLNHLERMIRQARREEMRLALLYFDLDHFKRINDSLGHDVGDQVLQSVAKRLEDCLRQSDFRARIGGDEFGIVLPRHQDINEIDRAAKRLMEALSRSHHLEDRDLVFTVSMGITVFPDDGEDVRTLLKNADLAMYEAKRRGRNTCRFFSEELGHKAQARLETEVMLRKALAQDEFALVYQPQVDLRNDRIFGFEALLRWNHPERGLVFPVDFIPLAEETGLIIPLGDWVLREVCRQVHEWLAAGLEVPRVSMNVSGAQFMQKDFFGHFLRLLQECEVPAGAIGMELTESILMTYLSDSARQLYKLRDAGLELSIDDFGKGYSSLSYLKQFPIDYIKIDKDFVQDISNDTGDRVIVETIIAMSQSLGMGVIAEGVESAEQMEFLLGKGCCKMQGYYFSKPKEAKIITQLLKKNLSANDLM